MQPRTLTIALGAALVTTLVGVPAEAGTASVQTIAIHGATATRAGLVDVAQLPRAAGHPAGSGGLEQLPFRTYATGSAAGTPAPTTAQDTRSPLLSIALGAQRTPALADSDNSVGLTPPDMGLGADSTHVVQMVNVVGRIWTGTSASAAFQLDAFFLASGHFVSDPWVLFDQESGRWFAGIFDVSLGGEEIAVSRTGDPTGTWAVYVIQYPGVSGGGCPDQGKGGVDSNVVALGFNEYSGNGCSGGFLGAGIEIFNKAQMVAGTSVNFVYTNPLPQYFSLVPAQALSSGQTTEFFAGHDMNSTSQALHRVTSVGVPGGTVTLTALADLTLAHPYPAPPKAKQPGTANKLRSGDQRMQHVVWKAGVGLLMTWGEGCTPAGDTKVRACGRVVATNDGVTSPAVTMDAELAKKGRHYVYPAATLNSANDVVVAFGVTSGKIFPQLDAAAAALGGAFSTPIVLAPGTTANLTNRYGDYFAVALDPSGTANKNVWAAGEIGGPVSHDWQTAIREVNVTP